MFMKDSATEQLRTHFNQHGPEYRYTVTYYQTQKAADFNNMNSAA